MAMSFNDLDADLQRSVWAATTILTLLLGLALMQIVNWILVIACAATTLYLSYKLFLEPRIKASVAKKKAEE